MKFLQSYRSFSLLFSLLLITAVVFSGCGDEDELFEPDYDQVPEPFDTTEAVEKMNGEDGVEIYVIEEGRGDFEVNERDEVSIFYTIRTGDNEVYDSSYESGSDEPLPANLAQRFYYTRISNQPRSMFDGFYQGLLGMKEGEKRTIVIPSSANEDEEDPEVDDERLIIDVELDRING